MADQQSYTLEFFLLFIIFLSAFGQRTPSTSFTERAALLDLRSSLGIRARDWPRKNDPCLIWVGVQCGQDGRVVGINVSGFRRTRLGRLNPQFSVDSLANFTQLAYFNASGFSLPGSIPDLFGQSLSLLQVLDLRSCSIVGPIPSSLGNLTNLNSLYLSNNSLTGLIPSTLGQLLRLSVLDLSQNSFTGSIPFSFSSLPNLTRLDLSSNFLSGSIPSTFGALSNLQFLNLSSNSLSSSIPVQLGDLSRLVDLDLGMNSLSGSVPPDLFLVLIRLQFVVLSHNSLSGNLPDLLWSMPELSFLDVSNNNFTGILPNVSLNSNTTTAMFNLSHNEFYGNLTAQFKRFSFIDLSDNYFEGRVSDEIHRNASLSSNCLQNVSNQRTLEDCTSFYAERGLTFDNFGLPNSTQPPTPRSPRKSNNRLALILVGVFGGIFFIVVLVVLLLLCLRRRERGVADQQGTVVEPVPAGTPTPPTLVSINFSNLGESFTYEQLLRATGDFGDSNLIKHGHSGDLFKGLLENGIHVVVKRIDTRSFKKESYMVELDLFSKAMHMRLVPLLGHSLEHENEKLLVYKYMPNGDLFNSLHSKTNQEDNSLQSLDWITRLKIAIGAAEGLSYLHHECSPPLVHR